MSRFQLLQAHFGQEVERWLPPDVGDRPPPPEPEPEPELEPEPEFHVPTAEEIAAIEEAARVAGTQAGYQAGYDQGYRGGYDEGCEKARQEADLERQAREAREAAWLAEQERALRETVAALELVARNLADPLASTADDLEPELLALVTTLARRVVMEELRLRPELVQEVLHQALTRLPSRNHKIRVHLHPDDRALLEAYAASHGEQLTWLQDPSIERGGCRIESGPSRIDATLETRLRQSIEAVWGELAPPSGEPAVAVEPAEDTQAADAQAPREEASLPALAPLDEPAVADVPDEPVAADATPRVPEPAS